MIQDALAKTSPARLIVIVWAGLLFGLVVNAALVGGFILDDSGRPIPGDFFAVWAAGRATLQGHLATVYDPLLFHALHVFEVGHPLTEYYLFMYPLPFAGVAALLAEIPYQSAYIIWAVGSLMLYAFVARWLYRSWSAAITYGAAPACFGSFIIAQNGLFTAALFGAFLLTLPRRPILSGVLLAALAYKPQFGILVPFALAFGGHWRTIAVAAMLTAMWAAGWWLFDPASVLAFVHQLNTANFLFLQLGLANLYRLESVFGLARAVGAESGIAYILQAVTALAALIGNLILWQRQGGFNLKAAALCVGALLATPYVYIYDFPLLCIAIGFLHRHEPFDRIERYGVFATYVLTILAMIIPFPFGFFASVLVAVICGRRANSNHHHPGIVDSDRAAIIGGYR